MMRVRMLSSKDSIIVSIDYKEFFYTSVDIVYLNNVITIDKEQQPDMIFDALCFDVKSGKLGVSNGVFKAIGDMV